MIKRGYYEGFGGAYIPEILAATFDELVDAFEKIKNDLKVKLFCIDLDDDQTYSCFSLMPYCLSKHTDI